MIAHISGSIIGSRANALIIETGGIGYMVFVTAETVARFSSAPEASLWTTHIVREDASDLYGFETLSDQELFELLLQVSGIGPKSALGVMNVANRETIARAVSTNDVGYLTKISGIGRKTAEKIILELRDKLTYIAEAGDSSSNSHDVIDALIALGYSESQVRDAVRTLDNELDTQGKIKEALRLLNK